MVTDTALCTVILTIIPRKDTPDKIDYPSCPGHVWNFFPNPKAGSLSISIPLTNVRSDVAPETKTTKKAPGHIAFIKCF